MLDDLDNDGLYDLAEGDIAIEQMFGAFPADAAPQRGAVPYFDNPIVQERLREEVAAPPAAAPAPAYAPVVAGNDLLGFDYHRQPPHHGHFARNDQGGIEFREGHGADRAQRWRGEMRHDERDERWVVVRGNHRPWDQPGRYPH